jgi:hypothetical protein
VLEKKAGAISKVQGNKNGAQIGRKFEKYEDLLEMTG